MIKKLLGLVGGSKITLALIGGAFLVGSISGGWVVYKVFRAGEVGALTAEITRMQEEREAAIEEAVAKALADRQRDADLATTLEGLESHEASLGNCRADPDVGRLLNIDRTAGISP